MEAGISDILDANMRLPRSQASHAYQELRSAILAGRLAPDEKVKVAETAARIGVSPGAVREALSRLVSDQLVVSRDQRGFFVTPLSLADLEDLTELRCEIETIALRRAIERRSLDWEAGIIASAHRLAGTPRLMPDHPSALNPDWVRSHAAFHSALIAACGSRRLVEMHRLLYEQSERYRGVSVTGEPNRDRNVVEEHERIVKAALSHDIDRLVGEVVQHIRLTTRLIMTAQ